MALIRGKPFLEILIRSLAMKGVRDFVFLTGYMGEVIEEYFDGFLSNRINIRFSREHSPLGTGGAVKLAAPMAGELSLLVNGDTFLDADLEALVQFHQQKSATVTLSLYPVDDVSSYGSVELDNDGRITGFREKMQGTGPGLVNAGFSVLSKEFIQSLPDGTFSMEREVFPVLVKSGKMFGFCGDRPFFDIGTPDSYREFETFVSEHPEYFSCNRSSGKKDLPQRRRGRRDGRQ
jgi:D-glycero-alpha-D-manno-heptose 1-phosphate guanylyltransferase